MLPTWYRNLSMITHEQSNSTLFIDLIVNLWIGYTFLFQIGSIIGPELHCCLVVTELQLSAVNIGVIPDSLQPEVNNRRTISKKDVNKNHYWSNYLHNQKGHCCLLYTSWMTDATWPVARKWQQRLYYSYIYTHKWAFVITDSVCKSTLTSHA
jgi:hypothetical protein